MPHIQESRPKNQKTGRTAPLFRASLEQKEDREQREGQPDAERA